MAESLKHFAAKRAMNIEGLGDKWVDQLMEKGLVKHFSDIYDLTPKTLMTLERQGERSAEKLCEAIARSKDTTLARFIFALGIRLVGERTGELLALHFGSIEKFTQATEEELLNVEEVGATVAHTISEFLADKKNRKEIELLLKKGIKPKNEQVSSGSQRLIGQTFVITGTLGSLSREDAENLIRSHGGKVTSSVSKNTNFVVVGENPGSKLDKAKTLGVAILDEKGLRSLLG